MFSKKKALRYLLALFIIFTLNFIIPRAMPGDPITNLLGENFVVSKTTIQELKIELGLDKSLPAQYLNYWKDIFTLRLGYSYHFNQKVISIIFSPETNFSRKARSTRKGIFNIKEHNDGPSFCGLAIWCQAPGRSYAIDFIEEFVDEIKFI